MITEIVSLPVEALVWIVLEEGILLLPKEGCWLCEFFMLFGYEHAPKILHLVLFTLSLIGLALEIIDLLGTPKH